MRKRISSVIIIISAILLFVFAVAAIILMSPAGPFGDRETVRKAITAGKIEISSDADKKRYFDYLEPEEIATLLSEHESRGELRFLFPQFDMNISDGERIIISEEKKVVEGTDISYITVKGLATGRKVYADLEGFATGAYEEKNDPPYVRIEERVISEAPGIYGGVVKSIYVPTLYVPGGADSIFLTKLDGVLRRISLSDPLVPIMTNKRLSGGLDAGIAVVIEKDGIRSLADLDNVLLSKNGRIVMVKR